MYVLKNSDGKYYLGMGTVAEFTHSRQMAVKCTTVQEAKSVLKIIQRKVPKLKVVRIKSNILSKEQLLECEIRNAIDRKIALDVQKKIRIKDAARSIRRKKNKA